METGIFSIALTLSFWLGDGQHHGISSIDDTTVNDMREYE
jgi:hypothetical protein